MNSNLHDKEKIKNSISFWKKVLESMKKKDIENIDEGEGGGAAAGGEGGAAPGGGAGGEISGNPISTTDVLGKWDPNKGCLGVKDYHIPKRVSVPFHRWECCNGGSVRKKGKNGKDKKYYTDKGVSVVYNDLQEKDASKVEEIFIYDIPYDKVEGIIDNAEKSNKRFDKQNFTKFIGLMKDTNVAECIGLFDRSTKKCLSMAFLRYNDADCNDCYINEIQCFVSGKEYGKKLLLEIIEKLKNVWLMANVKSDKGLVEYYRQPCFDFKEHVIEKSIWNSPAHFFYTRSCNEKALIPYLNSQYSKELVGEDDDPFASLMTDMKNKQEQSDDGNFNAKTDDSSNSDRFQDGAEIIKPDQIVKADNVYFYDLPKKNQKYKYRITIGSIDNDPEYNDTELIVSREPLSIEDIFNKVWPISAKKFNLNLDMEQAHRELNDKISKFMMTNPSKEQIKDKLSSLKFPTIVDIKYGDDNDKNSDAEITIVPNKEIYDTLTNRGIPAAYYSSEKDNSIIFNKQAEYKRSLKNIFHTLDESKKPVEIENKLKKCTIKQAEQQKPKFKNANQKKNYIQSQSKDVKIEFEKQSNSELKKQDQIVTTKAGKEDCDKYNIGDIVMTPWKKEYKIISKKSFFKLIEHPLYDQLTDRQLKYLKDFDQFALLSLVPIES